MRLVRTAGALGAATLVLGTAGAEAAGRTPSLAGAPTAPRTVEQRAVLELRVPVRARTSRPAPLPLAVVASRDARFGRGDVVLVRRTVRAPRRRGAHRLVVRVTVPASLPAGTWRVLVCRQGRKRAPVGCRAAGRATRVLTPAASVPAAPAPVSPSGGPAQPSPAAPAAPAAPPAPVPTALEGVRVQQLDVSARWDPARAVTRSVSPEAGGTLVATGADGAQLQLVVPPGAVQGATTITMAPLTGVDGLPFAEQRVAGAHLEPDGLRLERPATLRITPPAAVPADRLTGFAFDGSGAGFHLAPTSGREVVELQVAHFSGAGVGEATPAERAAQRSRSPLRTEGQFQQELALAIRGEGGDLLAIARSYYLQILRPRLEAGVASDERGRAAIADVLGLARTLHVFASDVGTAFDAEFRSQYLGLVEDVLAAAFERSRARCIAERAPEEAVRMLSIARSMALLGLLDDGDERTMAGLGCLRFDLDLVVDRHQGSSSTYRTVQVRADRVPVRLDDDLRLTGAVPLVVSTWDTRLGSCASSTAGPTEVVRNGTARLDYVPVFKRVTGTDGHEEEVLDHRRVGVAFDMGEVRLRERYFCHHDGYVERADYQHAIDAVRAASRPQPEPPGLFLAGALDVPGGDPFARRRFAVDSSTETFALRSSIEVVVRHTPFAG